MELFGIQYKTLSFSPFPLPFLDNQPLGNYCQSLTVISQWLLVSATQFLSRFWLPSSPLLGTRGSPGASSTHGRHTPNSHTSPHLPVAPSGHLREQTRGVKRQEKRKKAMNVKRKSKMILHRVQGRVFHHLKKPAVLEDRVKQMERWPSGQPQCSPRDEPKYTAVVQGQQLRAVHMKWAKMSPMETQASSDMFWGVAAQNGRGCQRWSHFNRGKIWWREREKWADRKKREEKDLGVKREMGLQRREQNGKKQGQV